MRTSLESGCRGGPRHFLRLGLMERLLKKNLRNGLVLDAGCGDGALSIRLAKRGFLVTAVDSSEEWCGIFERRLHNTRLKEKIKIICSPLEKANFTRESFDAIVCGELLEHIENDREIMEKLCLLLRKNGILILSVPLINKGWDTWDKITGHTRLYALEELTSLLEHLGFQITRIVGWGYPLVKLYNKLIFEKWAKKAKTEDEIKRPTHFSTYLGKSYLVSCIIGLLFYIDTLCTPPQKAMGIVLSAKKIY